MGGASIDKHGKASLDRLFVAGEDQGGVHGGNRLGGNGICESSVYGRQTGKALARFMKNENSHDSKTTPGMAEDLAAKFLAPFQQHGSETPFRLRAELQECNWNKVGIVRNGKDMEEAMDIIGSIRTRASGIKISGSKIYNMPWNAHIDFMNMLDVSDMVVVSALARKESRAAHYRSDFPEQDDENGLFNSFLTQGQNGMPKLYTKPVEFRYKTLQECQNYKK
jgi:succinate dehydrogenase / fumarate reductase flavoprotein subunit/fumarate reductase flavoprotein subunit